MSQINSGSDFYGANYTPTISAKSQTIFRDMPKYFDIWSLAGEINSFRYTLTLQEEIKKNPIKAKIMSLSAAFLIAGIIVCGALGAHYAANFITALQGKNITIALGIVIVTMIVANVVGAYFNDRWHGFEPDAEDYAAPFFMSFFGIGTPIWRAFGNSWERCINEEFKSVGNKYDAQTHRWVIEMLDSQPQSPGIEQAKQELQAVYDFFSNDKVPTHIEMDNM